MSETNNNVNPLNLINDEPMNDAEQVLNKKIGNKVGEILPYATTFAVVASGFVMKDVAQNFSLTRLEAEISQHPYIFLSAGVLGILQIYASTRKSR